MSVMDEIVQAVNGSTKLDATLKSVLTEFLQAVEPAIATLVPTELQALLAHFASGNTTAVAAPLAGARAAQVVTLLDGTQQAMNDEVAAHTQEVAAKHAVIAAIQNAAVSILAEAGDRRPLS